MRVVLGTLRGRGDTLYMRIWARWRFRLILFVAAQNSQRQGGEESSAIPQDPC